MKDIINLENLINYSFNNKNLLINALTHSSYANENKKMGIKHNERLEFLGDSILGQVSAEYLFKIQPSIPEGRMTKLRSELVCETALYKTATELRLGDFILLGHGEDKNGGRERVSILADAVESLIAALYLDGGYNIAKDFIFKHILDKYNDVTGDNKDWKTQLQEYIQKDPNRKISYELLSESGPDHNKHFEFAVLIDNTVFGKGTGKTKKEAEQDAAHNALEALKNDS